MRAKTDASLALDPICELYKQPLSFKNYLKYMNIQQMH
jgi:hypothetical protein